MKVNRVADRFQEQSLTAEGYDTFFEKMIEICSSREIDQTLGEELKNYATEWLKENCLESFDNYSDKAYSRTYIGRSATGWEAIVMGWKRGNRTSIHSHPQFAAYNFADGEFEIEIFEPTGEGRARLVERVHISEPQSFYAIGKAGAFDNHIHRITCLSEQGHSLHIYSDNALQGITYEEE